MPRQDPGFFRCDRGQDLAEYCMLTALVALVAAAIFVYVSGGVQNLWFGANTSLNTAGAPSAQHTGTGDGSQPARR